MNYFLKNFQKLKIEVSYFFYIYFFLPLNTIPKFFDNLIYVKNKSKHHILREDIKSEEIKLDLEAN